MNGRLGKYQMVGVQHWKGLTTDNHISAIFKKAPQKASNFMIQLLAANGHKNLDTFLSKFPVKEFETDDEYTWDVVGSSRRNIPLVEARTNAGVVVTAGTVVGANVEPFKLVFAEDWFADGEVIVGNLNEKYPLRILGDPKQEGIYTVYTVELMGGITAGMPGERLLAGERFSVEYAPVEDELSRGVGDIRFSSPISMRNEFSTIRIQHKLSGKRINDKFGIGLPYITKDGKKSVAFTWMHKVDYELETQFADAKANLLAFGRSNRNSNGEYLNIGKSGNVIRMGAGLYEQMEVANTIYYNEFSLDLLENALYDLCSNGKLAFGQRHFVMMTGERGAAKFHKAVCNAVNGWGLSNININADNVGMINKTSSPLNKTSLAAGYQFTEYRMPNGVEISVCVDPYYDDAVRNKIPHPDGGPAFSYRYDIFDIGNANEPNIFKVKVKGEDDYRMIKWGFRDPITGRRNNDNSSTEEDSSTIHKMSTLGICVLDPTRTMSLIPNVLMA